MSAHCPHDDRFSHFNRVIMIPSKKIHKEQITRMHLKRLR